MIQVCGDLRFPVAVIPGVCSVIQKDVLCHPRNPHALGRQAGARWMLESTSNGTQHTCARAVEFQPENSTCDKLKGKKISGEFQAGTYNFSQKAAVGRFALECLLPD